MLERLKKGEGLEEDMVAILSTFHETGPVDPASLEKLAYYKKFHPDRFAKYEPTLINLMGLFFKTKKPTSMLDEVYGIFRESIRDRIGEVFTPVQASAYQEIRENNYFSFSAPTSSGKSHMFRALIRDTVGDIVIVVPSRALIAEYYFEIIKLVDKSTLVLQFVENVNTANINRRIFIITPERGAELFKRIGDFKIELFLFDEAQISEEKIRGMTFDSFVRRVDRVLPDAKKIFAHPFVDNPEAQLLKHRFDRSASAKKYDQLAVGKVFLTFDKLRFEYFSPNAESQTAYAEKDLVRTVLEGGGTLLVYISKRKIYNETHLAEFQHYVDMCAKITDTLALGLIEKLREFIGASKAGEDKHSILIAMMERGIVVHHGSIPLKARLIIEDFVKRGYSRICFATATLMQGINMPFDIVWIDNFHNMGALNLKNLIGRAGRSTGKEGVFDFGYTIVKKSNRATFERRYREVVELENTSVLDEDITGLSIDLRDIAEATKNDGFDERLRLTNSQVERLQQTDLVAPVKIILDALMDGKEMRTAEEYYRFPEPSRKKVKKAFEALYTSHLRKRELNRAEKSVLSAAIPIMLWQVQGKSFSEIVSLRYAFLGKKSALQGIRARLRRGELSQTEAVELSSRIKVRYSPIPFSLPNGKERAAPLYEDTLVKDLAYDVVVYDSYDYLDKVISFSLVDPICAAFSIYRAEQNDDRASVFESFVRYGTNNPTEIWLLRYGFGFDDIEWIKHYVKSIDSSQIVFNEEVGRLGSERMKVIERYIH